MSIPDDEYRGRAQAAQETRTANAAEITAQLDESINVMLALIAQVNELLNLTNAQINSNPAPVIKSMARGMKDAARQAIRVARLLTRETNSTYVGNGDGL